MALSLEEELKRLNIRATALGWSSAQKSQEEAKIRARFTNQKPAESSKSTSVRASDTTGNRRPPPPTKRPSLDPDYIHAPYRFVEVMDAVVFAEGTVRNALHDRNIHTEPLPDGVEGQMILHWTAETPLLVGVNEKMEGNHRDLEMSRPVAVKDGEYWLPGASFRGMIRSTCEILGFGRLSRVNRDDVFPLRDFVHPYYSAPQGSDFGSPVSRPADLKMGWLSQEGKFDNGLPRLKISNAKFGILPIDDLLRSSLIKGDYTLQSWIESDTKRKYLSAGMAEQGQISFSRSFRFLETKKDISGKPRLRPDNDGMIGWLAFSNQVPKTPQARPFNEEKAKKIEYVLLESPESGKQVCISEEAVRKFVTVNSTPTGNGRKLTGSYQILEPLLKQGKPVPVFYVGDLEHHDSDPQFAFGLTRMFKIPHRFSVGEVIDRQSAHQPVQKQLSNNTIDMIDALFGFVEVNQDGKDDGKQDALRGRVAFSGARILSDQKQRAQESGIIETVMMAGRASFAPFYLRGTIKDWSDREAKIAGRKVYPARTTPEALPKALEQIKTRLKHQVEALPENARGNQDAKSRISFLYNSKGESLSFTSRIDLHNVTKVELGLLLYALRLGRKTECRHMFGRGKPFGMGQLRLDAIDLSRVTMLGTGKQADEDDCIRAFTAHMRAAAGQGGGTGLEISKLKDYPLLDPVKDLFANADPAAGQSLNGPGSKPLPSNKRPNPAADNYLRLRYEKTDLSTGKSKNENPYVELRKATMPLKDQASPEGQPNRLLSRPRKA